jgi:hypothetical protein
MSPRKVEQAGHREQDAGASLEPARIGRHINFVITDVTDVDQLVSYAAGAQIARLIGYLDDGSRAPDHLTEGMIAECGGMSPQKLAAALRGEDQKLTNQMLRQLDEAIVVLAPSMPRSSSLASLGARLRGSLDDDDEVIFAKVPPSWTAQLLDEPSEHELGMLVQASTLLSMFRTAKRAGRGVGKIRDKYLTLFAEIVRRLILIGAQPPTARNVDALLLLGGLARYAFDDLRGTLEEELEQSPFAFRIWRAVTKLIKLAAESQHASPGLESWVIRRLEKAQEERESSIYPGRSLDLEAALVTPYRWGAPGLDNPVTKMLLARAHSSDATLRERSTAAHGLWQRAMRAGDNAVAEIQPELEKVVEAFSNDAERRDIETGLHWVAATLNHVMGKGPEGQKLPQQVVCNDLPIFDEPWYQAVTDAAASLANEAIPAHILSGTRTLFLHTLLQNAGVERRQAIDTLIAGGYTREVSHALERILQDGKTESWLRIRAIFALGFLQHQSRNMQKVLIRACKHAYANLTAGDDHPTQAEITEMHAILFAIADCYGARTAYDASKATIRAKLVPVLDSLVEHLMKPSHQEKLRTVARATAYLLTVTAQPTTSGGPDDLSTRHLRTLQQHTDPATVNLCTWALQRPQPDGTILDFLLTNPVSELN